MNAIAPGFVDTELTQSLSEDQRKRIAAAARLRRLASLTMSPAWSNICWATAAAILPGRC